MKYLIIVNPTSGRGYAEESIPTIEACLRAHSLDSVVWTQEMIANG